MVTSFSRIFYGHIICLLKFPHYLYLDPIVHLDVMDQIFKCTGNYFLLGTLITGSLGLYGSRLHIGNIPAKARTLFS